MFTTLRLKKCAKFNWKEAAECNNRKGDCHFFVSPVEHPHTIFICKGLEKYIPLLPFTISHETMHLLLSKVEGTKTCRQYDNLHYSIDYPLKELKKKK